MRHWQDTRQSARLRFAPEQAEPPQPEPEQVRAHQLDIHVFKGLSGATDGRAGRLNANGDTIPLETMIERRRREEQEANRVRI